MNFGRLPVGLVSRRTALGLAGAALSAPAIAMPVTLRMGGTGSALGGLSLLDGMLRQAAGVALQIKRQLGTNGGIRAAAAGDLDIAVSARPLTPAERATGLEDRLWSDTPLIFATRTDNEVGGLTSEQAVQMIGGELTRWPDGRQVRLTRRPAQDGDTHLLAGLSESMALAVAALQRRPGVLTAITDADKADALEATQGSFGVIGLGLVLSEGRRIRPLSLDGRAPTDAAWPLQKQFILVSSVRRDVWVTDALDALCGERAAGILAPKGYRVAARA